VLNSSRAFLLALVLATSMAGCGSSGSSSRKTTPAGAGRTQTPTGSAARAASAPAARLRVARPLAGLPEARSGIAAAAFQSGVVASGGLSSAGESTDTVFHLAPGGGMTAGATLPGPVHDAAATAIAGRLLLFGGGQLEGSNRILSVLPGPPRQLATMPQPLSDLVAVAVGNVAYVLGGWNGSNTNRSIYAVDPGGTLRTAGELPLGVRYPAAAPLSGRVIVAGGEMASGEPTSSAWSFDPLTRRVTRLPDLPAPTDHTAGASLDGRVYVLGGLRRGVFTDAILSWAPGERRWRSAGHLPAALADEGAAPFDGGIAVLGGRDASGKLATITLMRPG
jgi:N-acetylneuraminic acid mutarotase